MQGASSENATKSSELFGEVSLDEIAFPTYSNTFFRLHCGTESFDVSWGTRGENRAFCWEESGFPGFDVPIIIECDTIPQTSAIILETAYGRYSYAKLSEEDCFEENRNLFSKESGESLIPYGKAEEQVFLWCAGAEKVLVFGLAGGPKITF